MKARTVVISAVFILYGFLPSAHAQNQVKLETTFGDIVLELDSAKAPITVENFLSYVRKGHFKDLIFHRVIKGFMIQGGGHKEDMSQKPTDPPIANEAYNELSNVRGTIAMARTSEPHSATSQFYINTVDNLFLNYKDSTSGSRWGYCVFGKVLEGMDVVDSIEGVETESVGGYDDVLKTPIIITNAVEITTNITGRTTISPLAAVTLRKEGKHLFVTVKSGKNSSLKLYDIKGKTIFLQKDLIPGKNIIPLTNFSPGLYVYKIQSNKKSFLGKVTLIK